MNPARMTLIVIVVIMFTSIAAYALMTEAASPAPIVTTTASNNSPLLTITVNNAATNITKITLLPTDIMTFLVRNNTAANFSVSALNDSSYGWTQTNVFGLPIGQNYSGYTFAPTNGTLYYVTVNAPNIANNSVLVYRNSQLVFNATRISKPISVVFTLKSTRPLPPSTWNPLFGGLNLKLNVPWPSGIEFEVGFIVFGALMMYLAHRRASPIIMYFGMAILFAVGFVMIGLLTLLILIAYVLSFVVVNFVDKRKRTSTK